MDNKNNLKKLITKISYITWGVTTKGRYDKGFYGNNITNNSKEHDLNDNIDLNINFNISNGPADNTMQDLTRDHNTTRPSDLKSNKKSIMYSYWKLNRNYIKTKYSRVS